MGFGIGARDTILTPIPNLISGPARQSHGLLALPTNQRLTMSSLDSLRTRSYASRGIVRQVNNDASIGIRLRYIGTGTVTSVTPTAATDIVLITSDGGTDTYTFATYTTIGAVADAINADGIFEAVVIDALRSEGSADWFLGGAVTAGTDGFGNVVWDLLSDTSGAATMSICLSPLSPDFDLPKGHRVHLQEIVYNVDLTAAADTLQIWKRRGTVETKLAGLTTVDATLTTINFASGEGKITGGTDEEIIVHVTGTVINAAGNLIRATGIYE